MIGRRKQGLGAPAVVFVPVAAVVAGFDASPIIKFGGSRATEMVEAPSAPPGAPEEATFDLWIVGVILAALSNMLSSLGLLVMKVSADQDKGKACHRRAVARGGP